jgi:hypothetical protein
MVIKKYHNVPFYVAIALVWAIVLVLMVLIVSPSHAALDGLPVPSGCLCGAWLYIVAWLGASAFAGVGFTAAALFVRGGRDEN